MVAFFMAAIEWCNVLIEALISCTKKKLYNYNFLATFIVQLLTIVQP